MADGHHTCPTLDTQEELKKKIDTLLELQRKALESATYLGMTPVQAMDMDERREKITSMLTHSRSSKPAHNPDAVPRHAPQDRDGQRHSLQ